MITTKSRKHYDHFCTDCGTFLFGDGSMVSPYRCECGEWERPDVTEWVLKEMES